MTNLVWFFKILKGRIMESQEYSRSALESATYDTIEMERRMRGMLNANAPIDKPSALQVQEGGDHYRTLAIQPVEYIHANNIGFFEGCAIKYLTRWKIKNGLEDLRKAKHFIELLIELETKQKESSK